MFVLKQARNKMDNKIFLSVSSGSVSISKMHVDKLLILVFTNNK